MFRRESGLEVVHMVNETEGPLPETGAEANRAVTREQQMKAHPLDP